MVGTNDGVVIGESTPTPQRFILDFLCSLWTYSVLSVSSILVAVSWILDTGMRLRYELRTRRSRHGQTDEEAWNKLAIYRYQILYLVTPRCHRIRAYLQPHRCPHLFVSCEPLFS